MAQLTQSQALAVDILNPSAEKRERTHKLKQIVPEPRSFFMDVKCPGCFQITYVESAYKL
jgi:small subunit ribosomal protein S27e